MKDQINEMSKWRINKRSNEQTNELTNERTNEQKNERTDERTNRRKNERMYENKDSMKRHHSPDNNRVLRFLALSNLNFNFTSTENKFLQNYFIHTGSFAFDNIYNVLCLNGKAL